MDRGVSIKRWVAVAVPVVLLAALIGWRVQQRATQTAGAAPGGGRGGRVPIVSVVAAGRKDIVGVFEAVGNVEAPQNVKLAPKVSGRLEYLVVREGDPVKKGQALARIDPTELEAEIGERQAAVAQARSRLAQAAATEGATDVSVTSEIRRQTAAVSTAQAGQKQAESTFSASVASAQAAVTEAKGRVTAAGAAIENARAGIKSAQANLENANARHARIRGLYQQGFTAAQDVDDARTQVRVQEGNLEVANGQLAAAIANRDAALAQQRAAEERVRIARAEGASHIAAAKAGVEQARAGLSAARANTAQRPAYRQNLAALRAAVTAAEAQLRNTQAQLKNTVLTSPVDGFVTERNMDPGGIASPNSPVLSVQAIRQVYVNVPVPEEVSRQISPGGTAQVSFDALPSQPFTARIAGLNAAADPSSRQFTARLLLDNPKNLIKPGMFARVTIVTQRAPNAVTAPREAVKQTDEGPRVMVVRADNTIERRPVTLGISDAQDVAIKQGLAEGERIVTMSAVDLQDGQNVRVEGEGPGERGGGAPPAGGGQR